MSKIFDLRFITGIKWYKGALEALNNMTFLYDVNWNPNNTPKATFPVSFFHVKSCHEVMSSEVSQKQMLFYNSSVGANSSDPAADSGLTNVVADNIVIKPKVYKLDVVIPFRNLTLLDQSFVYNTHTLQCINEAFINKNKSSHDGTFSSWSTLSQPYFKLIKTLVNTLITGNFAGSVSEWIQNVVQAPDYNKESLEIMWRMRHIVKMKVWNSWSYKYVAIIDMDITKEGTEDGVYEATMTVQEMPIVSMYGQHKKNKAPFVRKNPLLDLRGAMIITLLDKAGGMSGNKE